MLKRINVIDVASRFAIDTDKDQQEFFVIVVLFHPFSLFRCSDATTRCIKSPFWRQGEEESKVTFLLSIRLKVLRSLE